MKYRIGFNNRIIAIKGHVPLARNTHDKCVTRFKYLNIYEYCRENNSC